MLLLKKRIAAKTSVKKSNAKSSKANKKPTVVKSNATKKKPIVVKRRGKNNGNSSRKGMKYNMTKEGSASHRRFNKNKRKYGTLVKSLCNKKKAEAPASLSEEFPEIKICKDVVEWAADKDTKECVGVLVHHHPAFMKWMGQTKLTQFVQYMKMLGFTPKHERWHWTRAGCGMKKVQEGSKGMLWYHPTFGPNSSETDLKLTN